jgi:sulfite reductase beta subunit-like hemoprotein
VFVSHLDRWDGYMDVCMGGRNNKTQLPTILRENIREKRVKEYLREKAREGRKREARIYTD